MDGIGERTGGLAATAAARLTAARRIVVFTGAGVSTDSGILKTTTVSFGQALPRAAWQRAEEMTAGCDAFLAVGSSLVVYPAARLPELAGGSGATLLILNREPTPLDPLADLVLRGECGELLPALVDAVVAGG